MRYMAQAQFKKESSSIPLSSNVDILDIDSMTEHGSIEAHRHLKLVVGLSDYIFHRW
jgi:hypothetical protein